MYSNFYLHPKTDQILQPFTPNSNTGLRDLVKVKQFCQRTQKKICIFVFWTMKILSFKNNFCSKIILLIHWDNERRDYIVSINFFVSQIGRIIKHKNEYFWVGKWRWDAIMCDIIGSSFRIVSLRILLCRRFQLHESQLKQNDILINW